MKANYLLIYDNTGRVWGIYQGVEAVPEGVQGIIAELPLNFKNVRVDVETKTAIYEINPITEEEITNLQNAIVELAARMDIGGKE